MSKKQHWIFNRIIQKENGEKVENLCVREKSLIFCNSFFLPATVNTIVQLKMNEWINRQGKDA